MVQNSVSLKNFPEVAFVHFAKKCNKKWSVTIYANVKKIEQKFAQKISQF